MAEITHQILDKRSIVKQVVIALVVGAVLLVSAVLPAEYGIDPLGIGKATGFSKLYVGDAGTETLASGPHKVLQLENVGSGADVPKPAAADNPAPATPLAERTDEVSVVIPAGRGLEHKVNMQKYGSLKHAWITDKGELYFDFTERLRAIAIILKATPLLIPITWQALSSLRLRDHMAGILKIIPMRILLSK